jgi:hypothetical protein
VNISKTTKTLKRAFGVLGVIATLTTTAKAVDTHGELVRKQDNAERLMLMNPGIRPKIKATLTDMEHHGYRPLIDSGVWRSPAEEAKKKAQGVSQVSFGFHNVTTPDGRPDSLAADITDNRWFWSSPKSFWLTLAGAAESHGLTTGIYWGLSQASRNKIREAIKTRNWNAPVQIGWDAAHVQPAAPFTISEARAGKRPFPVRPMLLINARIVKNAYLVNGHWYALRGSVATTLGRGDYYPSITAPVRSLLSEYGYYIEATTNRITTRHRFDIRAAIKTKKK